MGLFEPPGVLPSRRRGRDALGELANDFAESFSTSASRGFRVLVSSSIWEMEEAAASDNPGRTSKAGRGERQPRPRTSERGHGPRKPSR